MDKISRQIVVDREQDFWLREQIIPAYDAMKADPSRAVSAAEVRTALADEQAKALRRR